MSRPVGDASGLTTAGDALQDPETERTVYRHFRTRDDLYVGFWDHVHDRRLGVGFDAHDLESLQGLVRENFAAFDANSALVHVMLHSKQGLAMRLAPNADRQEMFRRVVDAEVPDLDAVTRRRTAAAAQVLYSAMSWEYLREYWQMDAHEASATVQLALRALLAYARTPPSPQTPRRSRPSKERT
jgi:AcrR family transcriptional regulator